MVKSVRQVLQGGVGYFWVLKDRSVPELKEDDARSGFLRRVDDTLEVHLLHDDPVLLFGADNQDFPSGLLGVTEHRGVMVLDVTGTTTNMNMGGSRASVERYRARRRRPE